MKAERSPVIVVFAAALLVALRMGATPVAPGQGVTLSQVNFTFSSAPQPDSAYGLVAVDFAALSAATGLSTGFVNISSGAGWVVQNLPVDPSSGHPGLGTMFNLGVGHGQEVSALTVAVDFSATPFASFSALPGTDFAVGSVDYNAEGRGGPMVTVPPLPVTPLVPWLIGGATEFLWETTRESVEQDYNQCGPASLANSLQWLEKRYGINVPHEHKPGIEGDPPDSLVGQIDLTMDRKRGGTVTDTNFMFGKLEYIAENGLADKLVIKHWGGRFTPFDYTYVGSHTATSRDQQRGGLSLVEWIRKEIADGEDVELALGGPSGHWVNVTGAGTILGIPWISWVHDANQGNPGGNNWWDGGYGVSVIRDGKLTNFLPNYELDFAVSESPIPDSGAGAWGMVLLIVLLGSRVVRTGRAGRTSPGGSESP